MRKAIPVILLAIGIFSISMTTLAEEITLTTYYPAPYGEYQELRVSGNVGIGTTVPDTMLHVLVNEQSAPAPAAGSVLTLEHNNPHIQFVGQNNNDQGLYFGDPQDIDAGQVLYNHAVPAMLFVTESVERVRITGTGNVGIGTTSPTAKLEVDNEIKTVNINTQYIYSSVGSSVLLSGDNFLVDTGNVGIGTTNPGAYKLYVNGPLAVNSATANKVGSPFWGFLSDIRLKDIKGEFDYGLEQVLSLQAVRYSYKKDNELGVPSDKEYIGLIAQDVQKVIPEAVRENEKGYLILESDPILWAMLNAMKELSAENRKLKAEYDELKAEIKILKSESMELRTNPKIGQ